MRCSSLSRGTSSTNSAFSISSSSCSRAFSSAARALCSGGRAAARRCSGVPSSPNAARASCIGAIDSPRDSATPGTSSESSCSRKSARSTNSACSRCNCSALRSSLSSGPPSPICSRTFSISRLRRRLVFSIRFVSATCCSGLAFSRRRSKSETCLSRACTRSFFSTSSSASTRSWSSRSSVCSIRSFSPAINSSSFSRLRRSLSSGSRSGCRIMTRRHRVSRALFS